jgi:hypothetical protein
MELWRFPRRSESFQVASFQWSRSIRWRSVIRPMWSMLRTSVGTAQQGVQPLLAGYTTFHNSQFWTILKLVWIYLWAGSEAHNFQIPSQMNDRKGSPDFSSLSSIGPSARTSWASQGDFQIPCSWLLAVVVRMFGPIASAFFSEEYSASHLF